MTLFSDRWLRLLSFAIWIQHTKVPNLGVVSGFSDSQLLLLSVLHNTATEQNTETLVFAVRLSQTETATAVFFAVLPQPQMHLKNVISGVTQRWQILGWSKLSGKSRVFAPLIHTGA